MDTAIKNVIFGSRAHSIKNLPDFPQRFHK